MSIAGFKIRQGDVVGQSVTLRGERMQSFFDKLVNVALPRTKDFRGIDTKTIDSMEYDPGIKEHTIFPETGDEELHNIFGLSITIVTTAGNKESAEKYLRFLGVPFKKKKPSLVFGFFYKHMILSIINSNKYLYCTSKKINVNKK